MKNLINHKIFLAAFIFFTLGISISGASVKSSVLEYENGMVSCSSKKISVVNFLEELAGVSNIEIYILSRLKDHALSVDFQQVPVMEALCRLLRGYSFALVYAEGSEITGQIHFFENTESHGATRVQSPGDEPDFSNLPALPAGNYGAMDPKKENWFPK